MKNLVEMFEAYAEERGFGPRLLHVQSVGYATYHLHDDQCFIEDIYIVPEKRKLGEASAITDQIVLIAKRKGLGILTGQIIKQSKDCEAIRKAMFAYGFRLIEENEEKETYFKEI